MAMLLGIITWKVLNTSHAHLVTCTDGHEPQRAYYSGLGEKLPKDTMLLTLGCGKFR
jgi:hydroxylamine reductase (hybrid-cluster protein)